MPNFSKFDLSPRKPRQVQIDTLAMLTKEWDNYDVFALNLPVATGKSAIARAIMVATGADVITPSNALVSQYAETYPYVNMLKGKTHYDCHKSGMDCKTWSDIGLSKCDSCPYLAAKLHATNGEPTFYNPMSLYFHRCGSRSPGNPVLVVDEAHQLASMILMLAGKRLSKSDYKFSDKCLSETYLVDWLKQQIARLSRLSDLYYKSGNNEKLAKAKGEIESLAIIKQGLEEDGQNYVLWLEKTKKETYLNIKPLFPPKFLVDKILGDRKVILMSGTLFPHTVKELIGDRSYLAVASESPIPVENRKIKWKPAPFKINFEADPKKLAEYIESVLVPGVNTLIHSTYSLSAKLAPHFTVPIIVNTSSEDKEEKLEEFKTKGGVFLASGCAEGLDLKGDLCRLNVIAKMAYPNLGDPGVQRRKALQDGQEWYALSTLAVLIQQAGRSTRTPDDYSTTIILDPSFKSLYLRYKHKLPKSFTEAIEL